MIIFYFLTQFLMFDSVPCYSPTSWLDTRARLHSAGRLHTWTKINFIIITIIIVAADSADVSVF